jgi:hypothetical protein
MEMQALRHFYLANEANRSFAPLGGVGASYASTPVSMDVVAPVVLQPQPTKRQPEQQQRSAHTGLKGDSPFAEEKTAHPSSDSSLVATLRNRRDEAESNDG